MDVLPNYAAHNGPSYFGVSAKSEAVTTAVRDEIKRQRQRRREARLQRTATNVTTKAVACEGYGGDRTTTLPRLTGRTSERLAALTAVDERNGLPARVFLPSLHTAAPSPPVAPRLPETARASHPPSSIPLPFLFASPGNIASRAVERAVSPSLLHARTARDAARLVEQRRRDESNRFRNPDRFLSLDYMCNEVAHRECMMNATAIRQRAEQLAKQSLLHFDITGKKRADDENLAESVEADDDGASYSGKRESVKRRQSQAARISMLASASFAN
jgi:hypothetical protein